MLFGYSYGGNLHVNITRVSCRQHCGATNFRIVLTFLQGTAFEKSLRSQGNCIKILDL
jgi:hypothetical protein